MKWREHVLTSDASWAFHAKKLDKDLGSSDVISVFTTDRVTRFTVEFRQLVEGSIEYG